MKIAVDINHPAHVHFFKNFIWDMQKKGHEVLVTASEKDVAINLLEIYGIPFLNLGSYGSSLLRKLINVPVMDFKMYRAVKSFKPDLLMGIGSIRAAHAARLIGKPCLIFTDTEHSTEQYILYAPFADVICTPFGFKREIGKKQVWYKGCHELAYLHPNYFAPDPGVLEQLGLSPGETFIVLRFVSWKATHDVGQHGIKDKLTLVRLLERYGRVLITSEGALDPELEKYQVKVSIEKLHDLLYYASLYIGEGGTTASEAAVLGTYAFHLSTTAKHCGVFNELNRHGLLGIFDDEEKAMDKIISVLRKPGFNWECSKKREGLLKEKIDVTGFMVWFVEEYPASFKLMKEDPDYQNRFISRRS